MGGLMAGTILFFILMPVLAVWVCCYLHNRKEIGDPIPEMTGRTPLI